MKGTEQGCCKGWSRQEPKVVLPELWAVPPLVLANPPWHKSRRQQCPRPLGWHMTRWKQRSRPPGRLQVEGKTLVERRPGR